MVVVVAVVVVVVTRVGDVGRGSVVLEAGRIVVGAGEVITLGAGGEAVTVGARDEAVTVGASDDDAIGDAVVAPGRVVVVEASFPPEHAAPTSVTATNPIDKRPITSAALRGEGAIPRPMCNEPRPSPGSRNRPGSAAGRVARSLHHGVMCSTWPHVQHMQ